MSKKEKKCRWPEMPKNASGKKVLWPELMKAGKGQQDGKATERKSVADGNKSEKRNLWLPKGRGQNASGLSDSLNSLMKGVIRRKRLTPFRTNENEEKQEDEVYVGLPYSREKVEAVVASVIEDHFKPGRYKKYKYEKADNNMICQKLSQKIREQLKTWPTLERHRIIALVSIVEKQNQGIHYKMKYSIDTRNDGYVNFTFDHPQIFVLACVMLIRKT